MELEDISPFYRFGSMSVAFNMHDFGNFIWGGAMKRLGFSREDTIYWANFNEFFTDTAADKRVIESEYDHITN